MFMQTIASIRLLGALISVVRTFCQFTDDLFFSHQDHTVENQIFMIGPHCSFLKKSKIVGFYAIF